jgi:ubiquinone/menaquinone biosynthesis C-methylase UbiE
MSRNKHQEFFDSAAADWDLKYAAEDLERLSHIVDRLGIKRGMDIVDLGCGTGVLFDMLRRKVGPKGSVTGIDFALQMAARAHRNFPFDNVNVVDADASGLPFADRSFDIAVAFASFAHFADKERSIGEIHRVLRPGGHFYIIHLTSSRKLAEIHQRIGGVVRDDAIPAEERLQKMFASCCFSEIVIEDQPGLYLAKASRPEKLP